MMITRRLWFRHAAEFCLVVGSIGAVVTAALGWCNGGIILWDDDWIQATHRWLGTGTAIMSLIALGLLVRASRPNATPSAAASYRIALFATTLAVATAGFFGGALIYGIDHYTM